MPYYQSYYNRNIKFIDCINTHIT